MANIYTLFSFTLPVPEGRSAKELEEWCSKMVEQSEEQDSDLWMIEFSYLEDEKVVWVYSEESGDVEAAIELCTCYLRQFDLHNVGVYFSWAETCSKLRVGEFGGGGVVVTLDKAPGNILSTSYDAMREAEGLGYDLIGQA